MMICRVPNNDIHIHLTSEQLKMLLDSAQVRALTIPMASPKSAKRKATAERLVMLLENAKSVVITVDREVEYGTARTE